jgi:hypothetical protein
MRRLCEFAGRVTRLTYNREQAAFLAAAEIHPFLARLAAGQQPDDFPDGIPRDGAIEGNAQPSNGEELK